MMGKVANFHVALFGGPVRKECTELYAAFEQCGARGINSKDLTLVRFQAALALALYEVREIPEVPVYILVPLAHEPWVLTKFKTLVGAIFRLRKGDRDSILAIRNAMRRLRIGTNPYLVDPTWHWVSFAFSKTDVLPPWMVEKLMDPPK